MKLLMIVFCCCTQILVGQTKPAWVDNPQSKYSNDLYLTALGLGDTRKAAEEQASANLSMIFEATIKAQSTVNEDIQEKISGGNNFMERRSQISKKVILESEQTLYNVQYTDNYVDPQGRNYVLAILNRYETSAIYKQKIADNGWVVQADVAKSDSLQDLLQKYAWIDAAVTLAQKNDALLKQLQIIDVGTKKSIELPYYYQNLISSYAKTKQRITFAVTISNDEDQNITETMKKLLTSQGFILNEKPLLRVIGKLGFEDVVLERPEKFVRWRYAISILDNQNATLLTLTESGREGHISKEEAQARAIRTMKAKLETNFIKKLNDYVDGILKK